MEEMILSRSLTPYDAIASDYDQDAKQRLDRTHILIPSAQKYCGDLQGKAVLDLGCGSGFFSRLLKAWGAKSVLGVDLSPKMIALARQQEAQSPLSIDYLVGDASNLGFLGEFDLVFASFLLHYSSSIEMLEGMCHSIAINLRSGGQFVSFNENPSFPLHDGIQYNVSVSAEGEIGDGTRMTRTHYKQGQPIFSFCYYHWEKNSYEKVLKQAGLEDIQWLNFMISPDADKGVDLSYWDNYNTSQFSTIVLTCQKAIHS